MKTGREEIIRKVESLAEPILSSEGLELVEVQYRRENRGWVLRFFIDRVPGLNDVSSFSPLGSGVTLEDCVSLSRELGRLLDVEDVIPGAYSLEVSSPGLNRPLKKAADFGRFAGRLVNVKIKAGEGQRKFKGRLVGLDNGLIRLKVENQVLDIPYDQAERVQLEPEIDLAGA